MTTKLTATLFYVRGRSDAASGFDPTEFNPEDLAAEYARELKNGVDPGNKLREIASGAANAWIDDCLSRRKWKRENRDALEEADDVGISEDDVWSQYLAGYRQGFCNLLEAEIVEEWNNLDEEDADEDEDEDEGDEEEEEDDDEGEDEGDEEEEDDDEGEDD